MHRNIIFSIILLIFTISLSCTKKIMIQISGSTTVLPVATKGAERFTKDHPTIDIVINAGGSGVGINQLGEGRIDIGMASREITKSEIKKYPKVHFLTHPVGIDAVIPVISSEIYDAGVHALTLKQIGLIYLGKIKNWKEIGGPDRDIYVVDKEKSRGTRHVFMKAVLGNKEIEAPGADVVLGSNNEEQTAITQSNSAIGMLSHAWLNKDVKGLTIIMTDGRKIKSTLANIKNGTFPILRKLNLITNGKPKGNIKKFIDFILSDAGQKIVESSGYVRIKSKNR